MHKTLWLRLRRLDALLRARDAFYVGSTYATRIQALIARLACVLNARLLGSDAPSLVFEEEAEDALGGQPLLDEMEAVHDGLAAAHNGWLACPRYRGGHGVMVAQGLVALAGYCDLIQMTVG